MDKNYCPYCMKKTEETVCPGCKRNRNDYESSPRQLPYGTILENRYVIGAVLGEGGFGITYLGIDRRLGLRVAIKEYFPSNRVSRYAQKSLDVSFGTNSKQDFEKGKMRFLREAQTMAKMEKQPEIVGVKDFFEAYGTAYIVMEYVDGETLKEKVKNTGVIPAGDLLEMIGPIMKALEVMHDAGLVHRDISPDNLMLEDGRLRLIDFGCARETASDDETVTIVLKHGYAPIEQYKHKGQGPWTDVYALCATMYFCLTGTAPPQAVDRLLDEKLIAPNELGAGLSPKQEAVLLKGMSIKPEDRFPTVGELHKALYQDTFGQDAGVPDEVVQKTDDENRETSGERDAEEDGEDKGDRIISVNNEINQTKEEEKTQEKVPYTEKIPDKNKKPKKLLPAATIAAAVIIVLIILIAVKPGGKNSVRENAGNSSAETSETEEVSEIYWDFDEETGTLTISGTGRMDDYTESSEYAPWYDCKEEITSVIIEDGIIYIGENSFRDCQALVSVSLPETLEEIGSYAFRGCDALTEIELPESLVSIDKYAFYGCDALTQIDIPAGVTLIEEGAFLLCEGLENINADEGNGVYASDNGIVFSKDMSSLIVYPAGKTVSSYTVPDRVTDIADYAFSGNLNIQQVNISENVENIGDFAFYCCRSLLEINLSSSNKNYTSEDGVLFTGDMQTLICYPCGITDTSYEVPDGVVLIQSEAFFNCKFLETVTLPDSVETIGSFAFAQCSALTEISLSDSLTIIYNHAFYNSSVAVLYIPSSVESIGEYAFGKCDNLTSIYYAGSEEQWDAINDDNNEEALSEITVYFNREE